MPRLEVDPPWSREAEESVISALFLRNDAVDSISELRPSEFYDPDNRRVFAVMLGLLNAGQPVDPVTVFERLQATGDDEYACGLEGLTRIANTAPSAANIRRYAQVVAERAKARALMAAGTEAIEAAADQSTHIDERIERVSSGLMRLLETGSTQDSSPLGELLLQHTQVLEDRDEGRVRVIPTGLTEVDEMLAGGARPGNLVIVAARPGVGKAQPLDALVLMSSGQWARMGDLAVGDSLASVDGGPSVVTGVFPQGLKRVLRVTFTDGRSVECCAEHLWSVSHRKWATPRVMQTSEVAGLMARPGMGGRLWVGTVDGAFGADHELPIDPWLLGVLLGDGHMGKRVLRLSKMTAETARHVRSVLPEPVQMIHMGGSSYRLSVPRLGGVSNPLMVAIRELGLVECASADRFIPEAYMSSCGTERLNLLRGILDADGSVGRRSVTYSTASARLARDVQALARSLGYWCSMRVGPTYYTSNSGRVRGRDRYQLTISGQHLSDLFLSRTKGSRCADRVARKRVAFASIVQSREAECQCISVSHPSRLYVTNDYVVTHNTAMAMTIAMHMAGTHGVEFLSMEMSKEELSDRALSVLGRIDLGDIQRPPKDPSSTFWRSVSEAAEEAAGKKLYVDDQGGLMLAQVRAKARAAKRKRDIGVLVVDYLQLMPGTDPKQNRAYQLEEVTRGLKALAKELGIVVIALAQVNRRVDARADSMPTLSDLKDAGALEQDADIVLFIHRPIHSNPGLPVEFAHYAKAFVAKNRQGRTGVVSLAYVARETRFCDWNGPPPVEPPKGVQAARGAQQLSGGYDDRF